MKTSGKKVHRLCTGSIHVSLHLAVKEVALYGCLQEINKMVPLATPIYVICKCMVQCETANSDAACFACADENFLPSGDPCGVKENTDAVLTYRCKAQERNIKNQKIKE